MKITLSSTPQRPKPRDGDRRTTKKHGVQLRTLTRALDQRGQPIGFLVSNGRPVFSWTCLCDLKPWDRHWLTAEERATYFPEVKK
jgi:hypothetical protein